MRQSVRRSTGLLSIKRPRLLPILSALFALALSFSGCVKRSRNADSSKSNGQAPLSTQTTQTKANDQQPGTSPQAGDSANQNAQRININTATAKELETLPGIGKGLADRIVEHRDKYGPFRRPEHLIAVRGISDRRFRALRDLITVE